MKKIILSAATIAMLALVSCSKDRVCECKYTSTDPSETAYTEKYTLVDVSKKTAKADCFSATQDYTNNGTTYKYSRTCELK